MLCHVSALLLNGLRDYGHGEQIGLEKTPELYVLKMVEVFTEVKRVLKKDGTIWLNLGDSYASGLRNRTVQQASANSTLSGGLSTQQQSLNQINKITKGLKAKDLIGIPWMVAFALRSSGWYLRQDIIWQKPNPMPESVTDRCTKAHEYIFLLSKSGKYYYDAEAIKVEGKNPEDDIRRLWQQKADNKSNPDELINGLRVRKDKNTIGGKKHKNLQEKGQLPHTFHRTRNDNGQEWESQDGMANKRSVWTVSTKPFSDAHFATFPEDLIVDCIKAGCPENGLILDPFMGAGTTGIVANKTNRNFIGFEINREYIGITEKRFHTEFGLFNDKLNIVYK